MWLKKNFFTRFWQVILHDPSEVPTSIHNNFRLPPEEAVFAAVTPEVIITEKDLQSYPPKQRKCYFDDEKTLRRFRHYSQVNCDAECFIYLMNATFECLDFYLPRKQKGIDRIPWAWVWIFRYQWYGKHLRAQVFRSIGSFRTIDGQLHFRCWCFEFVTPSGNDERHIGRYGNGE